MKKLNGTHRKPINRSKIRLFLGKYYYISKRFFLWIFGNIKFAKQNKKTCLQHEHFRHQTPLLRKLKDVDMRLQYNKIVNLKLAIQRLNQAIIYPGETFSFWKLVGRTSKRKGYLEGMVIFNGSFGPGIGGGLCQLSNLIYWMTIHTPLTVIERHRHDFDVFPDSGRTQPFGSGATCSYNYLDLMIRNNTSQPFQLTLEVTETDLIGYWKSDRPPACRYQVYEKDHRIDSEYWGGYSRHNTLFRKIYDWDNNLICDEYITENHAILMYQPFLESHA